MIRSQKIIITGTHPTPAIELIRQLKLDRNINWEIHYLGRRYNSNTNSQPSIESKIIPKTGVKFYKLDSGKFDRRWLPNTITGLPKIITGFLQSYRIIKKIKPAVVLSFGGYVSVPVIISAWLQRIPAITHEQTLTLSLSTRINSFFCKKVALSFPTTKKSSKYVVTGNLLRQEIFSTKSALFKDFIPKIKKHPLIFLTAGNQGSHLLNSTVKEILPDLTKKYTIIHQTGQQDFSTYHQLSSKYPNYHVYKYIESQDIGWVFFHSSLIICRAGANTTQEIDILDKKCIIIPLPSSQQNEQLKNAIYLKNKHPKNTILIENKDLNAEKLLLSINRILSTTKKNRPLSTYTNLNLLNLLKKL